MLVFDFFTHLSWRVRTLRADRGSKTNAWPR